MKLIKLSFSSSVLLLLFLFLQNTSLSASTLSISTEHHKAKKVLFINSYHAGYEWSDGIEEGIENIFMGKNIELVKIYMDTKRKRSHEDKLKAAQVAIDKIKSYQPDLVITADDNAAKLVIKPLYKSLAIPFIFTGVNWDAKPYGFPAKNVTGMEEVSLILPIIKHLEQYAKGNRIGLLSIDAISGKKNVKHFERLMEKPFTKRYYVTNFEQWKQKYQLLQQEVDLMILENPKGIDGWDNKQGQVFVENHTKIPSGTTHVWLAPYALITIAKVPQEQGIWAATNALNILSGKPVKEVNMIKNKQGKLFVNFRLAKHQNIFFKPALIKTATIIK